MIKYTITKIAEITGGKLFCNYFDNKKILRNIVIDSRKFITTNDSIFVAIIGKNYDGHNFIEDLYKQQVTNFIVSNLPSNYKQMPEACFVLVENTLKALQDIAAHHRRRFTKPLVAITGSNGKTIVKEWLFELLSNDMNIVRSPKSYNSQIGVPLSVFLLHKNAQLAIFEAGISKRNEMKFLARILKPDIGIFTNIGVAHQENFKNIQHKISEKSQLFKKCKTLIICKDHADIYSFFLNNPHFKELKLFTWSQQQPADVKVTSISKQQTTSQIAISFNAESFIVTIPFIDDASIENALHCITFMLYNGYSPQIIQQRLSLLNSVAMRLEVKAGINNCTLINDSYNSDLQSLAIAIDFLNQQQQYSKKTVILSDILQSGYPPKKLYGEVSEMLLAKNIHRIIGIGKTISEYAHFFSQEKTFYLSTNDFIANFKEKEFSNETILLKGARCFEFERILQLLQNKLHATTLEINLNALVHNLNYYKSLLKPTTKIMAMVKAFSYGTGMLEIANVLQYRHIDYLAVAYTDEAITLRKGGIRVPIVIMNPDYHSFEAIIEHNLEPVLYNFSVLEQFSEVLKRNMITKYPAHIKLDTGMHRLGFVPNEFISLANYLKNHSNIHIASIFSHLAAANDTAHDGFTLKQIYTFINGADIISKICSHHPLRHILNSSGIERFTEYQFDMVRLGIGMYGVSDNNQEKLMNVSSLKTTITQIKQIKQGDSVGYNRYEIAEQDMKIAILPIGYADGLRRSLGNRNGKVLVNNKFAPFVGNICMDMCMIDITGIDAREGEEVVVFGNNYPVTEISKQMNTIPYEVLTSISERVKRVFIYE